MHSTQKNDFWKNHIEACDKSNLSQIEYCAAQRIPLSTFGYWKRKLKKDVECKPVFYPLTVSPVVSGELPDKDSGLILHLQNKRFSLEIKKGFSASTLSLIVSTLEKL